MANKFVYTWTSGYLTEVDMPSTAGGCDSENINETSQNDAIVGLVGGDDPTNYDMTIPQVAIDYLEDRAMYLVQAIWSADAYLDVASGNTKWWKDLEQNCRDWNNLFNWCDQKARYCSLSRSNIGGVYDSWKPIKAQWVDCVEDLNNQLVLINSEIETIQGQSLNTATINEAIASANYSIAYAKSMEVSVEKEERISKFITLIVPILIVIFLIGLVLMWRKK